MLPSSELIRYFTQPITAKFFIVLAWDIDVDVNLVKQGGVSRLIEVP
ncbi:MAG: hypothetical protein IPN96_04730 [Anaerolineales bacterium]|nr:hypothetical protein [Anaerolineales bacterium]